MAIVTGLTKERMLEIEDGSVVSGEVDEAGDLILTTRGGLLINAGRAMGPSSWAVIPDKPSIDMLTGSITESQLPADRRNVKTRNTSSGDVNKWTKIATITIVNRYGDCNVTIEAIASASGSVNAHSGTFKFRAKQQDAFGTNPYVSVELQRGSGIIPTDLYARVIQNSGPTIVELYLRDRISYNTYVLQPLVSANASGSFELHGNQEFITSVPAELGGTWGRNDTGTVYGAGLEAPVSDNSLPDRLRERAVDISGKNIHDYRVTGFYRGNNCVNAPASNWWYYEVIRHDASYVNYMAYEFFGDRVYRGRIQGGAWMGWDEVLTSRPSTWTNVPLQNTHIFEVYPESQPVITRTGNDVTMTGALRNKVANAVQDGNYGLKLPSSTYYPIKSSTANSPVYRLQASGDNNYCMRVYDSGDVLFERYGPSTDGIGTWYPFYVTWKAA